MTEYFNVYFINNYENAITKYSQAGMIKFHLNRGFHS